MVDNTGRWMFIPNTPLEKMCDADKIAEALLNTQYAAKTSIENIVMNIIAMFDCPDNYGEYNPENGCGGYGDKFSVEECLRYVEESGGFKEFDYIV